VTEPTSTAAVEKKTDYIKRAIAAAAGVFLLLAAILLIRGFTSVPRTVVRHETQAPPPTSKEATTDAYHKRLEAYRKAGDTPDDVPTIAQARTVEDQHSSEEDRRAAEYIRNQLLLPMQIKNANEQDPVPAAQPANSAAPTVSPDDATRYADLQRRIAALHKIQGGGSQ
jgi:hypothetical protein